MISAKGKKLYFYTRYNKEKHPNDMEIDFRLSNESKTNFRIFPIEVKSSRQYIVHSKKLAVEHEIVKMPPYMVCVALK